MAARGLIEMLLELQREFQPGIVPDEASEIAGRYPQNGAPDSSNFEARQSPSPSTLSLPNTDSNFRKLVRRPSVPGAQAANESNVRTEMPDYPWAAPQPNTRPAGTHEARSTLPWGAPPLAPPLPVWPGRGIFMPRAGGPLVPQPPASMDLSKISMPEIPLAWKLFGLGTLLAHPEFRERFFDERDEGKDSGTAVSPTTEFYQKKGRSEKSKAGSIRNVEGPSLAPDQGQDEIDDNHFCDQEMAKELLRCSNYYPKEYFECRARAEIRKNLCYQNMRRIAKGQRPFDVPEKWGNK